MPMPLYKKLKVKDIMNIELKTTGIYHDLVAGVVAALEAKDPFTADHSLRVSDMTECVCTLLKLSNQQSEMIHMAAHVHDIGKIGIPDAVLAKAGPLSHEEWGIIHRHPCIGADILRKSAELSEIADIVLYHHERWDGRGYPDGLSGLAIPLGSRIIAICDSIDAMTTTRPYRRILSPQECWEEIRLCSGTMYDPDIVEVVLREWGKIVIPV